MARIEYANISLKEQGYDQERQLRAARNLLGVLSMRVLEDERDATRTGKHRVKASLDMCTFSVSDPDSKLRMPQLLKTMVETFGSDVLPVVRLYGERGAQTQIGFSLVSFSPGMIGRSPGTYAEIAAAAHPNDRSYALATEKLRSAATKFADQDVSPHLWGAYDAGVVFNALTGVLRTPGAPVNYTIRAYERDSLALDGVEIPQYGVRVLLNQDQWGKAPSEMEQKLVGLDFIPTLLKQRNRCVEPSDFIHGTVQFVIPTYPDDIVKP